MVAAWLQRLDIVKILISNGADVSAVDMVSDQSIFDFICHA